MVPDSGNILIVSSIQAPGSVLGISWNGVINNLAVVKIRTRRDISLATWLYKGASDRNIEFNIDLKTEWLKCCENNTQDDDNQPRVV